MENQEVKKSTGVHGIGAPAEMERLLPPAKWRAICDALYSTANEASAALNEESGQVIGGMILKEHLSINDKFLILCCGTGRHAIALAKTGFRKVTAVERSRELLRIAKRRAMETGQNVSFQEGDARTVLVKPGTIDCVAIFDNAFARFPNETDAALVLANVKRALKPGGLLLLGLLKPVPHAEKQIQPAWEWISPQYAMRTERKDLVETRMAVRETFSEKDGGVIADQIYGERVWLKSQIERLLGESGFTSITIEDLESKKVASAEVRDWLNRRYFVMARRGGTQGAQEMPKLEHITVVLNEPAKVKAEDQQEGAPKPEPAAPSSIETALSKSEAHKFTFLRAHADLLPQFLEKKPRFVLNAADRGYMGKSNFAHHLAAMLEVLNISFGGPGSECLALCANRLRVRPIAATLRIPLAWARGLAGEDLAVPVPPGFPVLVKTGIRSNAVKIDGNWLASNPLKLAVAVNEMRTRAYGVPIIVEEFLPGREYWVGVLGNPGLGLETFPVLEVDFSEFPENAARVWASDAAGAPIKPSPKLKRAELNDAAKNILTDQAFLLFEALGCRDYALFGYRGDASGNLKLFSVKANPSMSQFGKFAAMAELCGIHYGTLLQWLIDRAWQRVVATQDTAKTLSKRAGSGK